MNTTTLKQKERKSNHRAVAPVIATLLMVAIAVVGGTIIFVFAQGFFSSSQISGTPQIESLKILGYDARAIDDQVGHDGVTTTCTASCTSSDGNQQVNADERISVYVTNDSVQKVNIAELRFGGILYTYSTTTGSTLSDWDASAGNLGQGEYSILNGTQGGTSNMLSQPAAELQPGETATFVIDLDTDLRVGRSSQFKLTTSNGNVFVGTVSVGQQSG